MPNLFCLSWPRQPPRWAGCSLQGLNIEVPIKDALPGGGSSGPIRISPYFWGEGLVARLARRLGWKGRPRKGGGFHAGYSEARALVGKGAVADLARLSSQAEDMVAEMFASIGALSHNGEELVQPRVVQLRLSPELALWKSTQHAIGNVLPPKVIFLSEGSLLGMAAEATARGFDAGAVMSDLVFSSPGTDVVDVGSDLVNSEIINSFLNVADIATSGVVSEPALRAIYDAYAAAGARMFTQRWHEPLARMCATLYTWHMHNDRHRFLRRALLGWPKARKSPSWPQREADFDEVFDANFRTTGFSRPLDPEYACDGEEETCNHVRRFLDRQRQDRDLLGALWWSIVTGPLEYVRQGKVDDQYELHLAETSRVQMAQLFSKGLVIEMAWLLAHANHHAWQVNYLFEAAMFGSILDGGVLIGKLDRTEDSQSTPAGLLPKPTHHTEATINNYGELPP